METWRAAIPWARIPQTIQDAILVTIQLEIRHLWVDRFCIIQNDELEKELEIAKMPEIYSCAEITISATRAREVDDGFLYPNQFDEFIYTEEKFILPARLNRSDASAYVGTPPSRHLTSAESFLTPQPLDTRAWTFQESLLSRRMLHFTLREVQWECQRTQAMDPEMVAGFRQFSPYLPATLSRMRDRTNFNSIIASGTLYNEHGVRLGQRLSLEHSEAPDDYPWHALIQEYTRRFITNLADRARAISGVAIRIFLRCGDEYCAGLWRRNLSNQLGWCCLKQSSPVPPGLLYSFVESGDNRADLESVCDANEEQHRRLNGLRGLSWSWTSVAAPICFLVSTLSPAIEVIDVKVELKTPEAPFGDVNWGHLTVRGSVKHGRSMTKTEETRSTRAMSCDDAKGYSPTLILKFGQYISSKAVKDSMAVCMELKKQEDGLWARYGITVIPDSGWLREEVVTIK